MRALILLAAASHLLLAPAQSQSLASSRKKVSEADAVRLALGGNPDLLALRQGKSAAEARVSRVGLLANPELRFGITDIVTDLAPEDRQRTNVGLRWSPPRIGELGLKSAMAQTNVQLASSAIQTAENRIASEVRLLHRTICLLDEHIRIAEENVRLHEQIGSTIAEQVKAGVKTLLDRSHAELAVAEVRSLPARYRAERQVQILRLAAKMGAAADEALDIENTGESLAFRYPEYDRASLVREALERRSELSSAAANSQQSELSLRAIRQERYPWLSYVQFTHQSSRLDGPSSWAFQLGIDLPVFQWRTSSVAAASAELRQSSLRREAVKSSIIAEVDEVLVRLRSTARELAESQSEIETVQRLIENAEAQLASGQSDRTEMLLTNVRLLATRQAFVTKLMEFRALEVGLGQAVGRIAL